MNISRYTVGYNGLLQWTLAAILLAAQLIITKCLT